MRQMEINGVQFYVGTAQEALRGGMQYQFALDQALVVLGHLTVGDLLAMSDHDCNKIDTAVPQSWVTATRNNPQEYVWTYEGSNINGEPLALATVRREVSFKILNRLVERQLCVHS